MITLFEVNTSHTKWTGFLFLYGPGVGLGFQYGGVAAQAVVPLADVSIGTTMVMFVQMSVARYLSLLPRTCLPISWLRT